MEDKQEEILHADSKTRTEQLLIQGKQRITILFSKGKFFSLLSESKSRFKSRFHLKKEATDGALLCKIRTQGVPTGLGQQKHLVTPCTKKEFMRELRKTCFYCFIAEMSVKLRFIFFLTQLRSLCSREALALFGRRISCILINSRQVKKYLDDHHHDS